MAGFYFLCLLIEQARIEHTPCRNLDSDSEEKISPFVFRTKLVYRKDQLTHKEWLGRHWGVSKILHLLLEKFASKTRNKLSQAEVPSF